ncbi:glycoside hydrolase family 3 C-terminal domain-containing protein [Curtobacterium flaccumfaciens]|uniref:glycoside hydrolase family 3 C-terminal domain-containing protein n=1 Tax=Curtobacterium flaccumfaciens TaxID=2035 RepID=UPI002208CE4E|nr:glycoside hydrolase family 3 C-terminal domain-containing protein [Curtobacterium flaccumfaciens]UWD84172.1 glycoside hydrolase family 3 C-terminal domain-containing protein [Curtobacterium flaccumfaciens]
MNTDPSNLTLEEQASLLSGRDFWSTKPMPERGVPPIVMTDGPHGVRMQRAGADHLGINHSEPATCFPPAVAIGSSWDPTAAARMGTRIASEARALGVHIVLGPGVNIKRSPLCGRNFEYYSEDPYLSGVLGADYVTALQAAGVGASVKHFAANNQETDRMRVSADVDERTLRELYLPAFERVVTEAAPATVMCSYNKVNGVYASENHWLLTDVLRHDWGFTGAVVSDWGAVSNRVAGVAAGMDLEMPGSGGRTDAEIVDAVQSGELSADAVEQSVARVLALTELVVDAENELDADAGHALARELAEGSAVLLRNEGGVLPLDQAASVAVIGRFAIEPRFQGGGSSHINPTRVDVPLEAMQEHAERLGQHLAFAPGTGSDDVETLRAEAVELARTSEVAVVFAGLAEADESEGFDREGIDLPADQVALIRAVAAAAPKTVVVLSHGGVVALDPWHDDVDAVLDGFLLGQAAGSALANLLYGVANPSGHLAETIPRQLTDTPSFLNFPGEQGHVRYGEGVFVGYRYHSSLGVLPRYPFGYGLSYTTFSTDLLEARVVDETTVEASVTVTNSGPVAGAHVVQLYVATEAGPVRRPVRELRRFAKVDLSPGASTTVRFELDRRAFAYWDSVERDWVVAPGDYAVQVGTDADTIVAEQQFTLVGETRLAPLTMDSTIGEWLGHPVVGPVMREGMAAAIPEDQREQMAEQEDQLRMVESMPMQQFLAFVGNLFPPEALESLMALSRQSATDQQPTTTRTATTAASDADVANTTTTA